MVLEKTLESPLDYKEIQQVHPKGIQSWIFIGRTDAEAEIPDVPWTTQVWTVSIHLYKDILKNKYALALHIQ